MGQKILDTSRAEKKVKIKNDIYNATHVCFLGQLGLINKGRFLPRKNMIGVMDMWNSGF